MKPTLLIMLVLLGSAAGCGGSAPLPDPADPTQARAALQAALESWKNGEPAAALHGRTPPLYHNDKDRAAGKGLTSFRIENRTDMHGRQVRCTAVLSFRGGDGEKQVRYLIDTHPAVVITREDL
jgi:hypothetical protein